MIYGNKTEFVVLRGNLLWCFLWIHVKEWPLDHASRHRCTCRDWLPIESTKCITSTQKQNKNKQENKFQFYSSSNSPPLLSQIHNQQLLTWPGGKCGYCLLEPLLPRHALITVLCRWRWISASSWFHSLSCSGPRKSLPSNWICCILQRVIEMHHQYANKQLKIRTTRTVTEQAN